jgi:MtrB/PioB family decaheme-associated outer membrane protein
MSNRKTQFEVAGDYRIDPSNRLHLGYEYERVERWCNNALANNTHGVAPTGYVYTTNSCVQIPESDENKLVAGYKLTVNEALNFNAGYSYGKRNSDINSSFYNPMQAINQGFENPGYIAFFDASRTEQLFKAGVNWQATEKLNFGLNGRYLDDQFNDSTLGVQQGNTWSTNLDATYSYSENGTASAYMSLQRRQRDLLSESGRLPTPGALGATSTVGGGLWTNQLSDNDVTVGVSALQKGLMSGKLELSGALTYSINKSGYSTQVPYYIPTATAPTCSSPASLTCGDTPDIKNKLLSFNVTGKYQIDKSNRVTLGYMFQKLDSNDYLYNIYQTGYVGTGNLPTNEQLPSYAVSIVTATYTYTFK